MTEELKYEPQFSGFDKGALPGLGESLSVPTGEQKSKTNVNKFAVLAAGLIAFLFLVISGMLYLKNRQPVLVATEAAELAKRPGYEEKNVDLEAANIEGQKARIREAEEARAREEARAMAEIEAAERRMREAQLAAQPAPELKIDDPEERAMRTGVLLPLTGTLGALDKGDDSRGGRTSGGYGGVDEEEQRQREYEIRMRAAGLDPGGGAMGGGGFDGGALGAGGGGMGSRLSPTVLPARAAERLQDLTYLLKKGTTIPCALKTGIDTQLPGFVLCNVINDVYSANGKTLLIERGATLFGEQQSQLRQGQDRTFVIWSRVDNPSGVTVSLDSPATDAMGFSGVPGIVNHRFMERFGAAILLTIIKDFSRAAADRYSSRNQGGFTIGSDSSSMDSMAEEVLRSTINIPPTLIVKPATVVHVMVARDVTFESVYAIIR